MAIMTSRQAAELDHAFERNGWTSEDVKKVSGGDLLASLLSVVRGRAEVVVKPILILLRTFKVAARPAITTSEKYFKEAGVVWMGNNFKAQFLGLEIPATKETELAVHKLEEASLDVSILTELENKTEISVSLLWAFLDAHRGSQEWFIFYPKGKLWAVNAHWVVDGGGWYVGARSVTDPDGWPQGLQVVSQV